MTKHSPEKQLLQTGESDPIFPQLFERSADAQLLLKGHRFIDCNQVAVDILGFDSKEALLSLHPHDISPERQPDGRLSSEKAADMMEQAYRQGTLRFEWVHRRADGQTFPVEILLTALHLNGKRYLHSAWHDISERKQAEARLRQSKHTLEERVQERAGEVQALFKVQQAITSRLDPNVVLQLIADEARRLTTARHGAVYLLDGGEFEIAVTSGAGPPNLVGYRFPASQSVSGLVVQTRQPFLAEDAASEPQAYADLVEKIEAGSFLVVPLLSGAKALGVITVADKATGGLDERDERVLTMLASSAVIGLENARLYELEQRRRQVAEGLRDILRVLNSRQPLGEVLEQLVAQGKQLLGAKAIVIYHFDFEQETITIEATAGMPDGFSTLNVLPLVETEPNRAIIERRPYVRSNFANYLTEVEIDLISLPGPVQSWLEIVTAHFQAFLTVPLVIKDEVYGGISLYYAQAREFSQENIEMAVSFANQVALAIENARLRAQAEQSAVAAERSRLARDLHDAVTQTLFSANLIAEVLPDTWAIDPNEGHQLLGELRQLNRGALAEMRTLLLELRPSAVIETQLGDLLRQLADAVTGRTGLPVQLHITDRQNLPAEVHLALYRIAQEALNNVVKHARAGAVSITCKTLPEFEAAPIGQIELRISDDGRGFDPAQTRQHRLGLNIMAERAESIGAALSVRSEIGEGTDVIVIWREMTDESEAQ